MQRRTHPNPLRPRAVLLGLALLPALVGPVRASASPLMGDPDIPALNDALAPPSRSFLARDLDHLASRESLRLLLAGGGLALAVHGDENPDNVEALLDRPAFDGGVDAGNTYGNGALLAGSALALFAAGTALGESNLRGAGGAMARSLVYTGVMVTALKMGVQRTRPDGGGWSFPSGHTAAAFAVAPVLAHRFGPVAAIPAYVLAFGTGLGRMEDRRHYLSDVLAGAAIGLAVGRAVVASDESVAPRIASGPEFGIGPDGAQVTLHF